MPHITLYACRWLRSTRLDPTASEEAQCDALLALAMDGSRAELISCASSGQPLDAVTWASCVDAAQRSGKAKGRAHDVDHVGRKREMVLRVCTLHV